MQSFGSKRRIRKSCDYKRVYKSGKKVVGKYFVVYALPGENFECNNRLGISVSKRVEKKAASRNKIKRLLKEAFRTSTNIFKKEGYDICVVVRKGILILSFYEIKGLLVKAIEEACNKP